MPRSHPQTMFPNSTLETPPFHPSSVWAPLTRQRHDLSMISFAGFTCRVPTPFSRQVFFPETPPAIRRHRCGTLAAAGGTPALHRGTDAVHTGNNCGFISLEKGMKRNYIDMLRLHPETLTANFPPTGTKSHFTRVRVALKYRETGGNYCNILIIRHFFKCTTKLDQLLENTRLFATTPMATGRSEV
jgi:hypothetical protein